jgi:uncharacterized YkwD family protein
MKIITSYEESIMQYLQYQIQLGDSLQSIGRTYGVPMSELLAANPGIYTEPILCVGTIVLVPQMSATPATPTVPTTPITPTVPVTPSTPSPGTGNASLEAQVVELVNRERESRGLDPLAMSETLTSIARTKSEDMVANNYFSHNSPTYGSPFDMLRQFGVSYSTAGENIASGQTTVASVMDTWMNSPGHAANILNDAYTEIGVGVANNNGRPIWTQIFLRP